MAGQYTPLVFMPAGSKRNQPDKPLSRSLSQCSVGETPRMTLSQFTEDSVDGMFCTPQDQDVEPLSQCPSTPSPPKRRRCGFENMEDLSNGVDLIDGGKKQQQTRVTLQDLLTLASIELIDKAPTSFKSLFIGSQQSEDSVGQNDSPLRPGLAKSPQFQVPRPKKNGKRYTQSLLPWGTPKRRIIGDDDDDDDDKENESPFDGKKDCESPPSPHSVGMSQPQSQRLYAPMTCNANPFSPESLPSHSSKKKNGLRYGIKVPQSGFSRYFTEFEESGKLGSGSTFIVYKSIHRVDGWAYAIKKTRHKLRGEADKQLLLREVYALASLSPHPNVMRYHTAWVEDERLFIQTELCQGGTLANAMDTEGSFSPEKLLRVFRDMALGLHHLHSSSLVHLDIKPDNIYCSDVQQKRFVLGDLGQCALADGSQDVVEGDSRYLSRELLEEDTTHLPQSDIFALGCTLYELARGKALPSMGQEWQDLRDGVLEPLGAEYSELEVLIKAMLHPEPDKRPSTSDLVRHPLMQLSAEQQLRCEEDRYHSLEHVVTSLRKEKIETENKLREELEAAQNLNKKYQAMLQLQQL